MTEEKQGTTPPASASDGPSPWAVAGLGMQFFLALLAFVYAGNWIDARFGTAPVFLFAGVFVGGGATFYLSYRRLTRGMRTDGAHSATPPNDATRQSPRR